MKIGHLYRVRSDIWMRQKPTTKYTPEFKLDIGRICLLTAIIPHTNFDTMRDPRSIDWFQFQSEMDIGWVGTLGVLDHRKDYEVGQIKWYFEEIVENDNDTQDR